MNLHLNILGCKSCTNLHLNILGCKSCTNLHLNILGCKSCTNLHLNILGCKSCNQVQNCALLGYYTAYHHSLCNNAEEGSPHLLQSGSLKSRMQSGGLVPHFRGTCCLQLHDRSGGSMFFHKTDTHGIITHERTT